MRFQVENLGYLESADIELSDLTIICGKNNTGKTYLSYAIYGFLKTWNDFIMARRNTPSLIKEQDLDKLLTKGIINIDLKNLESNLKEIIKDISKNYSEWLYKIFSTEEDSFSHSDFQVLLNGFKPNYQDNFETVISPKKGKSIIKIVKDANSSLLNISLLVEEKERGIPTPIIENFINKNIVASYFRNYFSNPFIITSERTGISLFWKELDISKNVVVEQLQDKNIKYRLHDFIDMIDKSLSRYAIPIKEEIDFIRDLSNYKKRESVLLKNNPEIFDLLKEIIGGEYKVEKDEILFAFREGRKINKIPLHTSSSLVKAWLSPYHYIKHIARPGDILIIDEPELNLHPASQRKIAKLFVHLIKAGLKVLITTHSDYLIKELNNLIILGNDFKSKQNIMKKYKYSENDILDKNKIKVYIADNKTLTAAPINDMGIEIGSFDDEINEMNDMFNDMTVDLDLAYD